MSLPGLTPLKDVISVINSLKTNNIEQRVLLLDIGFSVKQLIAADDRVEQNIHLGDIFKMEEYVYHVFQGHANLNHIKQLYVEVHKYV